MSPELEEIYEHYLALTEEERVDAVFMSTNSFLKFLEDKGINEDLATQLFLAIIAIFVDADGEVSDGELSLLNKSLGVDMTKEQLAGLTRQCASDKDLVRRMDEIIDSLPNIIKADVVIIGLSLISADGELSEKEIEMFERILN